MKEKKASPSVAKCPTGITGLDEIMNGGVPRGRITLICGGPGCGKTLFGMTFLVRGALDHAEPGVLMSFEETEREGWPPTIRPVVRAAGRSGADS